MSKLLIVDDEPDTLEMLRVGLTRDNREIRAIENPLEALDELKQVSLDVLITDIRMPRMDGFTLMEEAIRRDDTLPCICLTAFASDETLRRALEIDCFGYVNKPFDWNYLNHLVDNALRMRSWRKRNSRWSAPGRLDGRNVGGARR